MEDLRIPAERRTDPDALHSIDNRLARVEIELDGVKNFRRWLITMIAFFVAQIGGFIYGYAQLEQRVENISLDKIEAQLINLGQQVSTALQVARDHGNEIATIEVEQSRIRGNIDQFYQYLENLRKKIDDQTTMRFFRQDGDRLEVRIKRLEDRVFLESGGK